MRSAFLALIAASLTACSASAPREVEARHEEACPATPSRLASPHAGRCYSRSDLERTGTATPADALRLLDPALTVHH
jgi:hypothetical protein